MSPTSPTAMPTRSGTRLSAHERRDAVLAVAIGEFARGGYAGTSTEAIARAAGISQPYLFRLFGSKRALFIETVRLGFGRVHRRFEEAAHGRSGRDALDAIAFAYGELIADRDLLLLELQAYAACSDDAIRAVVSELYRGLVDLVEQAAQVEADELRTFFSMGMLWNVVAALGLENYAALGCPLPGWPPGASAAR